MIKNLLAIGVFADETADSCWENSSVSDPVSTGDTIQLLNDNDKACFTLTVSGLPAVDQAYATCGLYTYDNVIDAFFGTQSTEDALPKLVWHKNLSALLCPAMNSNGGKSGEHAVVAHCVENVAYTQNPGEVVLSAVMDLCTDGDAYTPESCWAEKTTNPDKPVEDGETIGLFNLKDNSCTGFTVSGLPAVDKAYAACDAYTYENVIDAFFGNVAKKEELIWYEKLSNKLCPKMKSNGGIAGDHTVVADCEYNEDYEANTGDINPSNVMQLCVDGSNTTAEPKTTDPTAEPKTTDPTAEPKTTDPGDSDSGSSGS